MRYCCTKRFFKKGKRTAKRTETRVHDTRVHDEYRRRTAETGATGGSPRYVLHGEATKIERA